MIEILSTIATVFLFFTLILTVFTVGGVFIGKIRNDETRKVYPRWRVYTMYVAVVFCHLSGMMNEYVIFSGDLSTLKNLIIGVMFYVVAFIAVSFFAFKNPEGEDSNGQIVDFRNLQFFLIVVIGYMPIIILSI